MDEERQADYELPKLEFQLGIPSTFCKKIPCYTTTSTTPHGWRMFDSLNNKINKNTIILIPMKNFLLSYYWSIIGLLLY